MANMVIPNGRQPGKGTVPEAKTKPSESVVPARPRPGRAVGRSARREAPGARRSAEEREANRERERLLEYSRMLLEPLSTSRCYARPMRRWKTPSSL